MRTREAAFICTRLRSEAAMGKVIGWTKPKAEEKQTEAKKRPVKATK